MTFFGLVMLLHGLQCHIMYMYNKNSWVNKDIGAKQTTLMIRVCPNKLHLL